MSFLKSPSELMPELTLQQVSRLPDWGFFYVPRKALI